MKHYGRLCRVAVGGLIAIAGVAVAQAGRADSACGTFNDIGSGTSGDWNTNTFQYLGFNSAAWASVKNGNQYVNFYLGQQQDECYWDWWGAIYGYTAHNVICSVHLSTLGNPSNFGVTISSGTPGSDNSCNGAIGWDADVETCECR